MIVLPFPISLWSAYMGHGKNKTKSKPYRKYWDELHKELYLQKFQWPEGYFGYEMTLDYHSPTWLTKAGKLRTKDVDNYIKTLTDPLTAWLCQTYDFDDCQIVSLRVNKVYSRTERVVMTVVGVNSILGQQEVDLV